MRWSIDALIIGAPHHHEAGRRNGVVNVFYSTADSIKVAYSNGGNYTSQTVANVTALQSRPTHYRASVYPAAGAASSFDYYTGTSVVRMTGSASASTITWQAGDLGMAGVLDVHGVDRITAVRRNNQPLLHRDFTFDEQTHIVSIPLMGATSIQIRR